MNECSAPWVRRRPVAFTLVELLIATLGVGLLVGMLLPAAQAAREAARKAQCQANLKDVAQALSSHELANGTFPQASEWGGAADSASSRPWDRPNWVAAILPRLDHQPIADHLDRSQSIAAPGNEKFRKSKVETLLCPTDTFFNRKPFNGSQYAMGDNWARTNYAANSSLFYLSPTACGGGSSEWQNNTYRGVMGCGVAVGAARITDGLSNTILVCEMRSGLDEIDPRGSWAMGDSASCLWAAGSYHWNEVGSAWGAYPGVDCNGPNPANAFRMDQDNLVSCDDLLAKLGHDYAIKKELMGCWQPSQPYNNQSATRSLHPSGLNVCFADGSVRWISDYIDTNGRIAKSPPIFSIWDRLIASADGATVPGDAF